jgi:hypothetical protein
MVDGHMGLDGCTGSTEGHDGRLSVMIHEGARHTQETRRFTQVTLGVHIRARVHNQTRQGKPSEGKRWSSEAGHTSGAHLRLRQGGTTKGSLGVTELKVWTVLMCKAES